MLSRDRLREILTDTARRHGRQGVVTDGMTLESLDVASLEIAEFALRCGREAGQEIPVDNVSARRLVSVGDLLDMIEGQLKSPR